MPLIGSSFVFSTLIALTLNLLFRLGVKKTAALKVDGTRIDPKKIEEFMEEQGAAWGARRDVSDRARFNLAQSIETIVEGCEPQGPLEIAATFDGFQACLRAVSGRADVEDVIRR